MGVLPAELVQELKAVLGGEWVVTGREATLKYLFDEAAPPVRPKASEEIVVVKPSTPIEVAETLKLANKYKVPVYPRGGGTGLVGGAVPTKPGIVLSLERMDKLIVDEENMVAEAEAGVTLGRLIEEAEKRGLSFPPHPGDEGATVGGLVVCNAGGARAVRTGVMRNYVLGLEVVLPQGTILSLGSKTVKNNMGFNLAHLFIGSEGILGVVTKAYLRLYPRWKASATVIAPFGKRSSAINTATKILFSGISPLAIEYFDRRVIEESARHLGVSWPVAEGSAYLMLILAECSEDVLFAELEMLSRILESGGALEPVIAQRSDEQSTFLKLRSAIYTALKGETFDILDTTVPLGTVSTFLESIEKLESKYKVWLPVYGHVGDGNIHVHVLQYPGYSIQQLEEIRDEIYGAAVALGGVITGEHGIGAIRRSYVVKLLGTEWVKVMKELKRSLDPNNILNPDKVLPEEI
ncbi:MAG: FAD-binding oxidoreductase [Thermofilum sp.]|jgi:glycolate oxidase|nr:FAD-binding oxidoreductase [Thermofilum sp.]